MEEVTFPARIDAAKRVSWGVVTGLFIVLVIVATCMAVAVFRGSNQWAYVLPVLPLLVFAIKKASAPCESRQVLATLRIEGQMLDLFLPGTRFAGGAEFIDQLYKMRLADIESVRLQEGVLTFTARRFESIGLRHDQVVSREDLASGGISLSVSQDDASAVASLVSKHLDCVRL